MATNVSSEAHVNLLKIKNQISVTDSIRRQTKLQSAVETQKRRSNNDNTGFKVKLQNKIVLLKQQQFR